MQRRRVLQSLLLSPLALILPRLAFADKQGAAPAAAAAGAAFPALTSEDPLGKAMKYVADASKADAMRTDKKAFCSNCAKYAKCSPADTACKPGPKTAASNVCEIFAGKSVAKNGWCMSWTKA